MYLLKTKQNEVILFFNFHKQLLSRRDILYVLLSEVKLRFLWSLIKLRIPYFLQSLPLILVWIFGFYIFYYTKEFKIFYTYKNFVRNIVVLKVRTFTL